MIKTSKCMITVCKFTCTCFKYLRSLIRSLIDKCKNPKVRKSESNELLMSTFTSYKPSTPKYDHALCIVFLSAYLVTVDSCSDVVSFSAPSSKCHLWPNQSQICIITETTRLILMPQGQQASLLIDNKNKEPLGTISVEVERQGSIGKESFCNVKIKMSTLQDHTLCM